MEPGLHLSAEARQIVLGVCTVYSINLGMCLNGPFAKWAYTTVYKIAVAGQQETDRRDW